MVNLGQDYDAHNVVLVIGIDFEDLSGWEAE